MPTRDELLSELTEDPAGIGYPADAEGRYAALREPRYKEWLIVPALDAYLKQTVNGDGVPLWLVLDGIRQSSTPELAALTASCKLLWDWFTKASYTASSYLNPPLDAAYQWLDIAVVAPSLAGFVLAEVLTQAQADAITALAQPRQARDEYLWGQAVTLAEIEAAMGVTPPVQQEPQHG